VQLKTLIVEDESMARASMERLVKKNDHLEWVGTCENGTDGSDFLRNNPVDLLLLDVEMPDMDGFSLLEEMEVKPRVILTTSKEEYAFHAFQYRVFDYLKKPVRMPVFDAAIMRLMDEINKESTTKESSKEVYLKIENKLVRVVFKEIKYAENVGNYVKLVTESENLIVYVTMKELMEKLPPSNFVRVHRSFIVNTDFIQDIEQNSVVVDGQMIPVSRGLKADLMKRLNTL
jgi:DNA-binding LytR/AlgR family response regulator